MCHYHTLFINLLGDGHLGGFYLLALMSHAVINIQVQVFMCRYIFISYWGVEAQVIWKLCLIIWGTARLFQCAYTTLCSPQQCMGILIFPHFVNTCYVTLILAILVDVKWYHIVVSICLSLTKSVEHLFLCLFTICVSSLEKCLFRYFTHFWIGLAVLLLNFKNFLYILDTNPLLDVQFGYIFYCVGVVLLSWWCLLKH